MKDYTFTMAEMTVLREALADYKHHTRPDANSNAVRLQYHRLCSSLHEQFKSDIILLKQ